MKQAAQAVNQVLNDGKVPWEIGFVILAMPFGESDCNYISNCDRQQMLMVMKALIARWEGKVN